MGTKNYTRLKETNKLGTKPLDHYFLLFLLLISFHVVGNILWIYLNNLPPTWDNALHTVLSIKFLDYIKTNILHINAIHFFQISVYYPPFVHLIGAVFALAGNYDSKIIQLTGTLFFVVAMVYLYHYTLTLFKSGKVAFFTTFLFSFFISIFQQSRLQMLDLPLTAMVMASMYHLEKSEDFSNKKQTFLFILFASIGFLVKWYMGIYLLLPCIVFFWKIYKRKKIGRINWKLILKISLFFLFVIVSPWYLINLNTLIPSAKMYIGADKTQPQTLLSFENIFFYLKLIIIFQIHFIGFLLLIYSSVRGVLKKNSQFFLVLSFLIFNYLFFTLIGDKNVRLIFPLMPFIAIIMGYGLNSLFEKANMAANIVGYTVILYFWTAYFILSFGIPIYPEYKYALNFPVIGWTDIYYFHTYPVRAIYQNNVFSYEGVLNDILSLKNTSQKILLLADKENVNNGIFDPLLYKNLGKQKYNISIIPLSNLLHEYEIGNLNKFLDLEVDIVLIATGDPAEKHTTRGYDSLVKVQQYILSGKAKQFIFVKKYTILGDQYTPSVYLELYQKR